MKFSKVFFAALLAVVVGAVVSGLFWLFTILGLVGSMGKSKAVAVLPNTILRVDLADNIVDSPMINPLANLDFTNIQPSRTLPPGTGRKRFSSSAARSAFFRQR